MQAETAEMAEIADTAGYVETDNVEDSEPMDTDGIMFEDVPLEDAEPDSEAAHAGNKRKGIKKIKKPENPKGRLLDILMSSINIKLIGAFIKTIAFWVWLLIQPLLKQLQRVIHSHRSRRLPRRQITTT